MKTVFQPGEMYFSIEKLYLHIPMFFAYHCPSWLIMLYIYITEYQYAIFT